MPEDIALLAKVGVLVPLFDGFDEFAYRGIFCTQLQQAMSRPDLLRECSFVITSRPDADITRIPIAKEFHRTIDPLTEAKVREYITAKRKLSVMDLEAIPAAIRRLLSQPLYLCTWCNCVAKGKSPTKLGDLMGEMFIEHLERRSLIKSEKDVVDDGAAQADRKQDIVILCDLFARVCTQAATGGFGIRARLSNFADITETDRRRLGDVARRSGIIERIPDRFGDDELYVNKIPIVEYLIGWQMAQAFGKKGTSKSQVVTLNLWRRWVWQPSMHDVLDNFFDALWNSKDTEQEKLGRELITWLCNISNMDPIANEPLRSEANAPQDDLLRPFCISALRWLNLGQQTGYYNQLCHEVLKGMREMFCRSADPRSTERIVGIIST
ncbi:MAG TPA: hypothetical protein VK832_07050, partial [Burkholderiaceae bacterium]|nr:hypothetical protein [Burkholderiaceae bacterium]